MPFWLRKEFFVPELEKKKEKKGKEKERKKIITKKSETSYE